GQPYACAECAPAAPAGRVHRGVGRGGQSRPTIAPLTKEDARELFLIVGVIESLAGRLAAQLPVGPRMLLAETLRRYNTDLAESASAPRPDENPVVEPDRGLPRLDVGRGARARLAP